MAFPQPSEPSRRLAQAAAAERVRLVAELQKAENSVATLRHQLSAAEQRAVALRQRIELLDELGGDEPAATSARPRPHVVESAPPVRGWLRGASIREVAVRVLAASARADSPIHYSDWLEKVIDAGYGIQGRDPAASFLTQLSRSPVVIKAEGPGFYTLDLQAPSRLRARLIALNNELSALHGGQQTIESIVSERQRRNDLVTEIARIERQLEEALAAVGPDNA